MLNHARCLLVNLSGATDQADYLCHELIDPAYRPVAYPAAVRAVRRVLFGTSPDADMLAYRARQLLCLTEATPLAEYVYGLDSRVTYDFRREAVVLPFGYDTEVTSTVSAEGIALFKVPDPPDATGRVRHRLSVRVETAGTVAVERVTPPTQKVFLSFAAGDRLPLSGTGMEFKLSSGGAGQSYAVTVLSRPRAELHELCDAAAGLGEPTLNAIFGVTRVEPYLTFRELFFRKRELPLRLGALVCALAYRSDEARLAQQGA